MVLKKIADAFTAGGLRTIYNYSSYLPGCFPKGNKNWPLYILQSDDFDPYEQRAQESDGLIKVVKPIIFVFDVKIEKAVENKLLWISQVFKTIENVIGIQNEMPVEYQNILFHLFEPENESIDETATLYQDGLCFSSEKMKIGIEY